MGTLWFSPAVPVRTERVGLTRNVNNVEAAAEELLKWTKRGPKWQKAAQACYAALEGTGSPEEVRNSFEAAAKASGMLMENS
jgi:hypothetical protein